MEGDPQLSSWKLVINERNPNLKEYIYYFPKSSFSFLNFFKKIWGFYKGMKLISPPDLIHANVVHYHFIWLLFQRIPYVIAEHATHYHRLDKLPNAWLKKLVFKPIFRSAKAVMPVSLDLGQRLEYFFGNLPLHIVPNVVDTDRFQPRKLKPIVFNFLHISNLSKAKNISGILDAIKELNQGGFQFTLTIGGNGSREIIEKFRSQHQLENVITVLPPLSHHEVAACMQRAHCFILFSDFENQPCVLAEALACGLPYISSRVGGVEEFTPEFCILIDKGKTSQLVSAMTDMLHAHPFLKSEILADYAGTQFSASAISLKINKIYNDC